MAVGAKSDWTRTSGSPKTNVAHRPPGGSAGPGRGKPSCEGTESPRGVAQSHPWQPGDEVLLLKPKSTQTAMGSLPLLSQHPGHFQGRQLITGWRPPGRPSLSPAPAPPWLSFNSTHPTPGPQPMAANPGGSAGQSDLIPSLSQTTHGIAERARKRRAESFRSEQGLLAQQEAQCLGRGSPDLGTSQKRESLPACPRGDEAPGNGDSVSLGSVWELQTTEAQSQLGLT